MLVRTATQKLSELTEYLETVSAGNAFREVDMSELEFSIDAQSNLVNAKIPGYNKTLKMTKTAEQQLCSHIKMPYSYYNIISPELRLKNIRARMAVVKSSSRRVEFNEEFDLLRGFVPKGYNRIQNFEILRGLDQDYDVSVRMDISSEEALLGEKILPVMLKLGELDLPFDVSANSLALNMRLSELGDKFSSEPLLYRQICTNGAIVVEPTDAVGYELSYSNIDQGLIRTLVKEQVSKLESKKVEIEGAFTDMNANLFKDVKDNVISSLLSDRVSKTFIEKTIERIDDTMSQWDVFNIITERAQETVTIREQLNIERGVSKAFNLTGVYTS